jgi:hypothetical protein
MKPYNRKLRRSLLQYSALGALGLMLLPLHAYASPANTHQENASYSADVTSFHTSAGANGIHFATATVHLVNKTKKPLILACNASKVIVTDDQKNQYAGATVRGLGTVSGSNVDPKFVLPPGGGGDALFEVRARIAPTTIRGVAFDLNLATREIEALEGQQFRLGVEHALEFTGLKNGLAPMPEAKPTVDAGPFTATILRSKVARAGRWLTQDMTVNLRNTSEKPLILAYEHGSSFGLDDQGNRFGYGTADQSTTGIGVVSGNKADPQFVLAPGEAREVRFSVARAPGREIAGTDLTFYTALQTLEVLPSNQVRSTRQYSLTFTGLSLK